MTHPLPPPVPLKPLRVLRYCRLALIAIILRQTVPADPPPPPRLSAAPVPMSQRNFPASFWNSNYHSRTTLTSHDLYSDPYHAASLAGLHQSPDWYYPITSQAYGHNFSYGAGTSARYNQYPSLFLQVSHSRHLGPLQPVPQPLPAGESQPSPRPATTSTPASSCR